MGGSVQPINNPALPEEAIPVPVRRYLLKRGAAVEEHRAGPIRMGRIGGVHLLEVVAASRSGLADCDGDQLLIARRNEVIKTQCQGD